MCNPTGRDSRGGAKTVWFEARGAWCYAHLYREFTHDHAHLEVAERSLALLERAAPRASSLAAAWPTALDRRGNPAGPPESAAYGGLFVAEAWAEYAAAIGDSEYWRRARDLVLAGVQRYDDPGYAPDSAASYGQSFSNGQPGLRSCGMWMVLIRVTTQLLAQRADAALNAILRRAVAAVLESHLSPRYQLLTELLEHDFGRPPNALESMVYLGHAIECLWMIMDAGLLIGEDVFDRAAGLFRRHCLVARDEVYGGLFRCLVDVDANLFTLDKTLWVQEEALIGCMRLMEHRSDRWASDLFAELDHYVRSRFPMRELGSPLWRTYSDRQVKSLPTVPRVDNYHHPRYLMSVLSALPRLI